MAYWPHRPDKAGLTPKAVVMEYGGLILLLFLAFLVAWLLNRVRGFFRLGPMAYSGIVIVFVLVMLAMYTQQFR